MIIYSAVITDITNSKHLKDFYYILSIESTLSFKVRSFYITNISINESVAFKNF